MHISLRRIAASSVPFLRNAVWITFLLACVLCAALWPRSYLWNDVLYWLRPGRYGYVVSRNGCVAADLKPTFYKANQPLRLGCVASSDFVERKNLPAVKNVSVLGFNWLTTASEGTKFAIPFWFLVPATLGAAVALKPKPRVKFNLRDLLVAMTLIGLASALLTALSDY